MGESKSKDRALEDVLIMTERLALLHYAFAKTLDEELPPEQARELTEKAIKLYGHIAAENAMKRIAELGLEPTLENYKYGGDLPSRGWEYAPAEKPKDLPCVGISKITFCPLGECWKKLGEDGRRLGRFYCWVDQAKYEAYGCGYGCVHDTNTLEGDDFCTIRVTGKKEKK